MTDLGVTLGCVARVAARKRKMLQRQIEGRVSLVSCLLSLSNRKVFIDGISSPDLRAYTEQAQGIAVARHDTSKQEAVTASLSLVRRCSAICSSPLL